MYRYKETDCEAATSSASGTAAGEKTPCLEFHEAKCFYNTLSTKGRGHVPPAMLFVAGQDRQNHVYSIKQMLLNANKVYRSFAQRSAMGQYLSLAGVQFQWPPSAPLSTFGMPTHHGIIAAQVY